MEDLELEDVRLSTFTREMIDYIEHTWFEIYSIQDWNIFDINTFYLDLGVLLMGATTTILPEQTLLFYCSKVTKI